MGRGDFRVGVKLREGWVTESHIFFLFGLTLRKYFLNSISFISVLNSLDVLAMAAEKRKLEEIISSLKEENSQLKYEQKNLRDSLGGKCNINMRYDNLKSQEFKYYTGFSSATFNVIYEFLVPVDVPFEYSKNISCLRNLTMKDQLLFVLIKLRLTSINHLAWC